MVAILVLLWVGALSAQLDLWDELATWVAVGLVLSLMCASIPRAGEASPMI
jgi:hypothetical protein